MKNTYLYHYVWLTIIVFFAFFTTRNEVVYAQSSGSVYGLHVSGNRILNDQGQVVQLRGVDRGASGPCIQGWSVFSGPADEASVKAMSDWKINAVRIPLNEDCWLNINRGTAPAQYFGANYQKAIKDYVVLLNKYGIAPILDLHWSAPGTTQATDQQPMADRDHSPSFWTSVANTFKNNTSVVFDLYNEPYPDNNQDTTAAWTCLRDGGTCPGVAFTAAGMQELLNAVRATGSKNLVMVAGIGWSGLMTHWLEYVPTDPQNNLAASTHIYKGSWCHDQTCWDTVLAPIIQKYPLIVGEIGQTDCRHDYIDQVMTWLDKKGQSYTAWHWWPLNQVGCGNYPLITDYDGTPSTYGQGLHDHLLGISGVPVPPAPVTSPPANNLRVFTNNLSNNGFSYNEWAPGKYLISKIQVLKVKLNKFATFFLYRGASNVSNKFNISDYKYLRFDVSAKKPFITGFNVMIAVEAWDTAGSEVRISKLSSSWRHIKIPLSSFNVPANTLISGLRFRNDNFKDVNKGYLLLDNIRFTK